MSNPRTYLSLLACVAALAMAGCGSKDDEGDPIPGNVASAISEELTSVQKRLDYATSHATPGGEGACNDIEDDSFPRIERELARVPDGVKKDVRDALTESVDRLHELTRAECDKVSQKVDNTDTTPTETAPTVPQPETPTVPDETAPTTPTTPEKPKKPKKQPKQPLPGQGDQPGTGGGGAGAPGTP